MSEAAAPSNLPAGPTGANIKPLSGATLEVGSGAAFAVNNINAGVTVRILSGAALTLRSGTISAGTLVETLSGDSAIVSGGLADFGTLLASGTGSLVEILSDGVVNGGAVLVGNGIVDVLSGGSANVSFQSTGSGGLEIADQRQFEHLRRQDFRLRRRQS